MTNFENKKDECMKILAGNMALVDGKLVLCEDTNCYNCDFYKIQSSCNEQAMEWLLSEYQEPAPKLTKKEREFLECFSAKDRKAISRYTGGKLAVINTTYSLCEAEINSEMFPFVGSDKVWVFVDLLKLEVEE